MKSKLVTVLIVIAVVLVLILGGLLGYMWYVNTHVFVEGKPYPISAQELDLTQEDISFDHYNELHELLPDCKIAWNVPFQGSRYPNDSTSLTVSSLDQSDINIMKLYFPQLRKVNASACMNYNILESLREQMPELQVDYAVSLGNKEVDPDATELVLENGEYEYDTLMKNLNHLPKVTDILLRAPELTLEQIAALREEYPSITITCTVEILGNEYDASSKKLDLSALTPDLVETMSEKLAMLPELEKIELMDGGKSNLEPKDVKKLIAAAPQVAFHYSFDFYGQTLSTDEEEVHIKGVNIGDSGEENVRLALDLMRGCKRFVLEGCNISNEVMAKIRDDYREQTKVVWRIYFGQGTSMTDAEVLRSVYDLMDDNSYNLRYLEDVRYMDIGHDEYLDSIDFVSGMKSLEVVIISGSPVKDLSPFANCPNLRILEAANCGYITDLTPLAKCEKLEMLNICYTKVRDLSPLDNLNLTHLQAKGNYSVLIPFDEQNRFTELHPDCITGFGIDGQPYGVGWRYESAEVAMEWYKDIQVAFRYPNAPNNVGWYLNK